MTRYGQIVVGPPGAGKTTYCNGMQQYLNAIGRKCLVVNLDPANEYPNTTDGNRNNTNINNDNETNDDDDNGLPYDTVVDVATEIISASAVMEELDLGPNGALLYCMQYLDHHFDQVIELINQKLREDDDDNGHQTYILFDVPGQVEVFTHTNYLSNMVRKLTNPDTEDYRLCSVQLIDAHHCSDSYKFIGSVLLVMTTMLRLELPAVNVLSKVDLLSRYGQDMAFNLEFFTQVHDLRELLDYLDDPAPGTNTNNSSDDGNHIRSGGVYADHHCSSSWADDDEYQRARQKVRNGKFYRKHRKLHSELCDIIEDFSLVSFLPLNIQDAESVGRVVARIDKANGYVFGLNELKNQEKQSKYVSHLFQCAAQADDGEWMFEQALSVQERYMDEALLGTTSAENSKQASP